MTRKEILSFITEVGIVPIVRTNSAESAVKAVEAIYAGGVRAAEITMTVPGALRALEKVADQFGGQDRAGRRHRSGSGNRARLHPGGCGILCQPQPQPEDHPDGQALFQGDLPGRPDPHRGLTAWDAGADIVKIFPCGNVGGAKYIKALKGPFPQIEMIPTGGVNLETAGDFLKAGACAVAVGGELVDAKSIKEGRYEVIEQKARQYLEAVAKARAEMKAASA